MFAPVPLAGRVADAVQDRFGAAHGGWLAAAVALHVGAQVARGLAWHGVLTASWPRTSRTRACAWYICGAGLSGLISAPGGDAVRVSLAKRELPAASWPALGGTLVAEKPFEIACSVLLTVVALSLGVADARLPSALVVGALAGALLAAGLAASRSARARRTAREVARGAAVLRRPRRWLGGVAPWQVAGRLLKLGSAACFLVGFGLPATPAVVLAAAAAMGSGGIVPLPGAGPAAVAGALLVAVPLAAGHRVDGGALSALAVVQPLTLGAVGVTASVALFAALSGARTPGGLLRAFRALRARPAGAAP